MDEKGRRVGFFEGVLQKVKERAQKHLATLIMGVIISVVGISVDTWNKYYSLPAQMQDTMDSLSVMRVETKIMHAELHQAAETHYLDSIMAMAQIKRIDSAFTVIGYHEALIEQLQNNQPY